MQVRLVLLPSQAWTLVWFPAVENEPIAVLESLYDERFADGTVACVYSASR